MENSGNSQSTVPENLMTQQSSSTNKQSTQVDLLPRFQTIVAAKFGSQQLSASENNLVLTQEQASMPVKFGAYPLQSVPMEPQLNVQTTVPAYLGLQQLSPTISRPYGLQTPRNVQTSMSINMGSQPSLSTNKRPAQMEALHMIQTAMPINVTSQQLSANKRPQMEPPSKVQRLQTESFESVRSKLRDSLAAALGVVFQKQSKTQIVKTSSDSASTPKQAEADTQSGDLHSISTYAPPCGISMETLTPKEQCQKPDEGQNLSSDTGPDEITSDKTKMWTSDAQEYQAKNVLPDDEVSFSNDSIIKDELLQGHGLCWASDVDSGSSEATHNTNKKRPKLAQEEVTGVTKGAAFQNPENLATKMEAELFRLFGGVNKKYKEKGRSLLFNLKDRNNPELRERVLSGVIAPERLCSMTAEELASKELSQWRLAKAEELAHMVVLQDSEVDIRRLVKKTHKGEFQVEVEQYDGASVEVGLGTSVLSQIPRKANEESQAKSKSNDEGQILSKPNIIKVPEGLQSLEEAVSGDPDLLGSLDTLLHEKSDLMQEFMVDELKETDYLSPVVSSDEFMEALDKEPPFENLSMYTEQDMPSSVEKNSDSLGPEMNPPSDSLEPKQNAVSDSLGLKSNPAPESSGSKVDSLQYSLSSKLGSLDRVDIARDNTGEVEKKFARTDSDLKSGYTRAHPVTFLDNVAAKSGNIWEGLIQLNISALATVISFFRSGEKTSTQEWPSFLEIKGRVRLDAFEKFLQELPLSRSRAIMIAQFCWKEGSPEIGRLHLCETVNSYVADERVGFAEPAPGVELYFCPPHPKTIEMLTRYLPEEHTDGLQAATDCLIGVIVWRRPVIISPRMSSHKHKKQLSSRKPQDINPNSTPGPAMPVPVGAPITHPQPPPEDESIDDVPPGFGPGAPAREDDDLPEFDFVHSSQINRSRPSQERGIGMTHKRGLPPGRPVEQMRDLIHKYGQSRNASKPSLELEIEPWNDDDDIPEWQPQQDSQPRVQVQLQLPPPPLLPPSPPPPPQLHVYQQQTVQPFGANQYYVRGPFLHQPQLLPNAPPQQLMPLAAPLTMPLQPQMMLMPGPQNLNPGWQPATWWPPVHGPTEIGLSFNGMMQPGHFTGQPMEGGQFYGMPGPVQNGMGWRPDNPGGRGV